MVSHTDGTGVGCQAESDALGVLNSAGLVMSDNKYYVKYETIGSGCSSGFGRTLIVTYAMP
jgi:hypothetical protein